MSYIPSGQSGKYTIDPPDDEWELVDKGHDYAVYRRTR